MAPAARPFPLGRALEDAEALLTEYLEALRARRNLSPYTLRNYANDLRPFSAYVAGRGGHLLSVDRHTVRGYLSSLVEAGMAPASIARKVSTVRSFYRYLEQESRVRQNPALDVRGPKRQRRLPRFLPQEEVSALLDAPSWDTPQGLRDRAILELLYAAGIRVSELARLDVAALDLRGRELRVTGKGNRERRVLMGRPAAEALARYLRHGRPALARGLGRRAPTPTTALFLNRDGARLSVRSVQGLVRRYATLAGIEGRTHPHLLRHTFATHLLDGGADLRVVQELLGHRNVNTTQIYTHVTEERQRRVYDEAFYADSHPRARPRKR